MSAVSQPCVVYRYTWVASLPPPSGPPRRDRYTHLTLHGADQPPRTEKHTYLFILFTFTRFFRYLFISLVTFCRVFEPTAKLGPVSVSDGGLPDCYCGPCFYCSSELTLEQNVADIINGVWLCSLRGHNCLVCSFISLFFSFGRSERRATGHCCCATRADRPRPARSFRRTLC